MVDLVGYPVPDATVLAWAWGKVKTNDGDKDVRKVFASAVTDQDGAFTLYPAVTHGGYGYDLLATKKGYGDSGLVENYDPEVPGQAEPELMLKAIIGSTESVDPELGVKTVITIYDQGIISSLQAWIIPNQDGNGNGILTDPERIIEEINGEPQTRIEMTYWPGDKDTAKSPVELSIGPFGAQGDVYYNYSLQSTRREKTWSKSRSRLH